MIPAAWRWWSATAPLPVPTTSGTFPACPPRWSGPPPPVSQRTPRIPRQGYAASYPGPAAPVSSSSASPRTTCWVQLTQWRPAPSTGWQPPGLAERFEPGNPGMHATDSVDYVLVLDGAIWLDLDDGKMTRLGPGDTVI